MTEQQVRDFAVALGAEIRYWRKRKGMNGPELGKMVGLSGTTIGRIERGSEDSSAAAADMWRIAKVLGLSFSDLVRRAEEAQALAADRGVHVEVVTESEEFDPRDKQ